MFKKVLSFILFFSPFYVMASNNYPISSEDLKKKTLNIIQAAKNINEKNYKEAIKLYAQVYPEFPILKNETYNEYHKLAVIYDNGLHSLKKECEPQKARSFYNMSLQLYLLTSVQLLEKNQDAKDSFLKIALMYKEGKGIEKNEFISKKFLELINHTTLHKTTPIDHLVGYVYETLAIYFEENKNIDKTYEYYKKAYTYYLNNANCA